MSLRVRSKGPAEPRPAGWALNKGTITQTRPVRLSATFGWLVSVAAFGLLASGVAFATGTIENVRQALVLTIATAYVYAAARTMPARWARVVIAGVLAGGAALAFMYPAAHPWTLAVGGLALALYYLPGGSLRDVPGIKNLAIALTWTAGIAWCAPQAGPAWLGFIALRILTGSIGCDFGDRRADRDAGLETIATRLGEGGTIALLFGLNVLSFVPFFVGPGDSGALGGGAVPLLWAVAPVMGMARLALVATGSISGRKYSEWVVDLEFAFIGALAFLVPVLNR